MVDDARWMARAIRLSKRGYPAPNPHVGCVIVRDGQVVGEGFHRRAGMAHAEVAALVQAGDTARGATAYVTLEPCNHQGRTGPCSVALIQAGVRRVVYAVADPNPTAAGGHEALLNAGVAVDSGIQGEAASAENEVFLTAMRRGYPYVCIKAAASLDGRIALPSGESQWITGPESRRQAHRLRALMGAVLVGPGTVVADDPQLTARFRGAPCVVRVVLDPRGDLPNLAKVFDSASPTIHVVPEGAAAFGEALRLPTYGGRFDARAVLEGCFAMGIRGLLVEGGGRTIPSFLPYADRVELFLAGLALGSGPSWVESALASKLADAPRFDFAQARRFGADLWLTAVPKTKSPPTSS